MNNRDVIIISGPTASGKTSTSIRLAKKMNGEIINFDSLLFYKEISIGTAKPTMEERQGVVHHLVSVQSIKDPLNASDFKDKAIPIINDVLDRGKRPILVGGSGFYLQALQRGMYQAQTPSTEVIEKSDKLYQEKGIGPFIDILKIEDEESYLRLHENDHYRIRRAVEYFWSCGKQFSKARENMPKQLENAPPKVYSWEMHHLYLDIPKEKHWEIIESRAREIFKLGIIDEVRELLDQGYSQDCKPLQSIGYKQAIMFLNSEFKSLEECIERTVIATRQLAKAQRTWFAKELKTTFNSLEDQDKIDLYLKEVLE